MIGIGSSSYAKLEEGKIKVTLERLEQIAKALDMDIVYLLGLNDSSDSSNYSDKIVIESLVSKINGFKKKVVEYEKKLAELRAVQSCVINPCPALTLFKMHYWE